MRREPAMTIHEPWTFATDVALAALAAGLGVALLRRAGRRRETPAARAARLWGWALVATAAGALLGGLWHAIAPEIAAALARPLWKVAIAAIGVASALMLAATAEACLAGGARAALRAFALAQLLVYLGWTALHDDFVWVIADYASAMLIVLVLHAIAAARGRLAGARAIALAVLLSFAAAGIQQSPLAVGPLHHNDLYHLLQMAALYLFWRGARSPLAT
jgi:hypothetical protein